VKLSICPPSATVSGSSAGAGDNPNTTQTLEYIKDKYNAKIRKWKGLS
jgi:hypothetical protein